MANHFGYKADKRATKRGASRLELPSAKRQAIVLSQLSNNRLAHRRLLDNAVRQGLVRSTFVSSNVVGASKLRLSVEDSFRTINLDSSAHRALVLGGKIKSHNDAKKVTIIPKDKRIFGARSERKSWRVDSATKDNQAELRVSMPTVKLHVCTIEECGKVSWVCFSHRPEPIIGPRNEVDKYDCEACVIEYTCKKRTSFFVHLMIVGYRTPLQIKGKGKDNKGIKSLQAKGYSQGDKKYALQSLVRTSKGNKKVARKLTVKDSIKVQTVNQIGTHSRIYNFGQSIAKIASPLLQDKRQSKREKKHSRYLQSLNDSLALFNVLSRVYIATNRTDVMVALVVNTYWQATLELSDWR